jgi:predicted transcriptional regulator
MCLQCDEVVIHPFTSISSIEDTLIEKTYVVVMDGGDFYGLLTPSDVMVMGHQLAIDCVTQKARVADDDQIEEVFNKMNRDRQYVLPVFTKNGKYLGSTTYKRIIEEIGLLKKQPAEVKITNMIGIKDIETVKQSFIHELYHNTRNPLQVIHSCLNLYKNASNSLEKDNLLESIAESTNQIDDTISELFLSYFRNS